ncbi:protein-cysteine N-palmitoyltransferase HHAT [Petaurus breviceps papuanus]|uniref:protein-cysteine N-palmitoyltransferase HHAT n=1 Tax=Petaurus breviceps papuanus TaxID=3040969 RepID=UPI0036D85AF6
MKSRAIPQRSKTAHLVLTDAPALRKGISRTTSPAVEEASPSKLSAHEKELDQEFELETDALFGGLKKDPTDFEWSFWIEWGKQELVWLFLGHMAMSQVAMLIMGKHRHWFLMIYGMGACWYLLGAHGLAMIFLHTIISFSVAQFQSTLLSWLCSLLLLSTLQVQALEDVKRGWYKTENEYYLLQFTLTVRCLYYTSFSLEFCWQGQPLKGSTYSFFWLLAYVFYYPVLHNGPILNFSEFIKQMQNQESYSLKANLRIFVLGVSRLLCWWWMAELMIHLMYMHALYSSSFLLEAVSSWALGGLALAQVLFFYVKYLVLFGVPALAMQLDGLQPPALPRCVSTMHSFTGMWRSVTCFPEVTCYCLMGKSQDGNLENLVLALSPPVNSLYELGQVPYPYFIHLSKGNG